MDGKTKNLKYADLMDKLKLSIENEFYYESIFIEYAIFLSKDMYGKVFQASTCNFHTIVK